MQSIPLTGPPFINLREKMHNRAEPSNPFHRIPRSQTHHRAGLTSKMSGLAHGAARNMPVTLRKSLLEIRSVARGSVGRLVGPYFGLAYSRRRGDLAMMRDRDWLRCLSRLAGEVANGFYLVVS